MGWIFSSEKQCIYLYRKNPEGERWEAVKRKLEGADVIFGYVFTGVQTKVRD